MFADYLCKRIKFGLTLSDALSIYTDRLGTEYVALVRAGEESGTLPSTLKYLTKLLKKQNELHKKMINIMIYPSILTTVMVGMFFVFGGFVFPKMIHDLAMKPEDIPIIVKAITYAVKYLLIFGIPFSMIIFGMLYGTTTIIGMKKIKKKCMEFMMQVPILNDCIQYITLSHYMTVLNVAYDAGVPIIQTLSLAEDTVTVDPLIKEANLVTKNVEKGLSLTDAFEKTYLLPHFMLSMVSTGEKTGKLGEMFKDIANDVEEKLDTAISALSKAFEPLLMIVIGVGVAIIAIAIISMYVSSFDVLF